MMRSSILFVRGGREVAAQRCRYLQQTTSKVHQRQLHLNTTHHRRYWPKQNQRESVLRSISSTSPAYLSSSPDTSFHGSMKSLSICQAVLTVYVENTLPKDLSRGIVWSYPWAHLRVKPVLKINRFVWVPSFLKNQRFLLYCWYWHRTYHLFFIVNECTEWLQTVLQHRSKSFGHTILKHLV